MAFSFSNFKGIKERIKGIRNLKLNPRVLRKIFALGVTFVLMTSSAEADIRGVVRTADGSGKVNYRSTWDTSSKDNIAGAFSNGEEVNVIGKVGEWYLFQMSNKDGTKHRNYFMHGDYLDIFFLDDDYFDVPSLEDTYVKINYSSDSIKLKAEPNGSSEDIGVALPDAVYKALAKVGQYYLISCEATASDREFKGVPHVAFIYEKYVNEVNKNLYENTMNAVNKIDGKICIIENDVIVRDSYGKKIGILNIGTELDLISFITDSPIVEQRGTFKVKWGNGFGYVNGLYAVRTDKNYSGYYLRNDFIDIAMADGDNVNLYYLPSFNSCSNSIVPNDYVFEVLEYVNTEDGKFALARIVSRDSQSGKEMTDVGYISMNDIYSLSDQPAVVVADVNAGRTIFYKQTDRGWVIMYEMNGLESVAAPSGVFPVKKEDISDSRALVEKIYGSPDYFKMALAKELEDDPRAAGDHAAMLRNQFGPLFGDDGMIMVSRQNGRGDTRNIVR